MKKLFLLISIIIIYPIHAWADSGNFQLSFMDTQGNNQTQAISVEGGYLFEQESMDQNVKAGLFYGEEDSTRNTENWYGNIKNSHYITDFLYDYAINGFEVDEFAGYDLRLSASVGLGVKGGMGPVKGFIEAGPAYVYEKTVNGKDSGYVMVRAYKEIEWQITEQVKLTEECEYLYDYEDNENYRVTGSAGIVGKMGDNLSLKVGPKIKYVNKPPEGFKRTDVITMATVIFNF
jgi:putative salt-induced outer membrane protein